MLPDVAKALFHRLRTHSVRNRIARPDSSYEASVTCLVREQLWRPHSREFVVDQRDIRLDRRIDPLLRCVAGHSFRKPGAISSTSALMPGVPWVGPSRVCRASVTRSTASCPTTRSGRHIWTAHTPGCQRRRGAITFPATRTTNQVSEPWSNTSSTGTRESLQREMVANGSGANQVLRQSHWRVRDESCQSAKRRLHHFKRRSALGRILRKRVGRHKRLAASNACMRPPSRSVNGGESIAA